MTIPFMRAVIDFVDWMEEGGWRHLEIDPIPRGGIEVSFVKPNAEIGEVEVRIWQSAADKEIRFLVFRIVYYDEEGY